MENLAITDSERVVELAESMDGIVIRTFYAIYDPEFEHWMSDEPFDGVIWTKDPCRRKNFACQLEAEAYLAEFMDWRDVPQEREAT